MRRIPFARLGMSFYVHGIEPEFVKSYFEKYITLDPFTTTRFFFAVERVISTKDIMTHDEFQATQFYKEWAQPQGWIDFISAALEKSSTAYAECGVFRHKRDGATDEAACVTCASLFRISAAPCSSEK